MDINIEWSDPIKIDVGGKWKWKREWLIPNNLRSGFFSFWKKNSFKLRADGFGVYKNGDYDWYFTETKSSKKLFKSFQKSNDEDTEQPQKDFWVAPYEVKNPTGLRNWQIDAVSKLCSAINKYGSATDGSEMGVGKTWHSVATTRELDANFLVVCPKAVMSQWKSVIDDHFKLTEKCVGIINYELLVRGRKDSNIASYVKDRQTRRSEFTWKLPKKTIIIWDEAHKLKNENAKISKVCLKAFYKGYRQLFLSASLATTPLELRAIGTCLKMFKGPKQWKEFLLSHGCKKGRFGYEFNNDKDILKEIHKELFEVRGVRLRRDVIPNFPECEFEIDPLNMEDEDTQRINQIYSEMKVELKRIDGKEKNDKENEMTIRLRARQRTEIIKVPLIYDLVSESLNAGMSVVVFLNFSDSIDALAKKLNTTCIFDGRNVDVREQCKADFQSNKERVIILNSAAGSLGLNLPDLDGNHPRLSIVSPNDSAVIMKQVQGRTWRESSKSKSIQRLLFIDGTIEVKVADNVKQKLNNLDLLNDGDLKL